MRCQELKAEVWARLQEVSWNRYSKLAAESLRAAIAHFHGWDEAGVVVSRSDNKPLPETS
jgi:histidinol-phosphate/aromatic aminotransferase/cobyric acid decarboxylase-like protein